MAVTIVSAVMVMAAYFLILYAEVGFIQNKRFFLRRTKIYLLLFPIKKEISRCTYHWPDNSCDSTFAVCGCIGFRCMGWSKKRIWLSAVLRKIYRSALYYGDLWYTFLWLVSFVPIKLFPHFYPEVKGIVVPHMFGYNKKTAFYTFYRIYSCLRSGRLDMHSFMMKFKRKCKSPCKRVWYVVCVVFYYIKKSAASAIFHLQPIYMYIIQWQKRIYLSQTSSVISLTRASFGHCSSWCAYIP